MSYIYTKEDWDEDVSVHIPEIRSDGHVSVHTKKKINTNVLEYTYMK